MIWEFYPEYSNPETSLKTERRVVPMLLLRRFDLRQSSSGTLCDADDRSLLLCENSCGGCGLHLYRYTDKGGKEKAIDSPLYFLLHNEPNPEMT